VPLFPSLRPQQVSVGAQSKLDSPDKISKSVKHKTQIKSFSGATVEDLNDNIKPSLKRKPKNIILHVGTNDLKRENAKDIATKIDRLCKSIKSDHPQMSVSLIRNENIDKNKLNLYGLHLNKQVSTALAKNIINHINCLKYL